MAVQLALALDATPPGTYRQRGTSSLQRLFRAHFPELVARYESEFAKQLGMFRLERISKAVERFLACGDYRRGIAGERVELPRFSGQVRACVLGNTQMTRFILHRATSCPRPSDGGVSCTTPR